MSPERWQRLKPLFFGALDRPEDERAAFLDGACGGDGALRAEIEGLLAIETPPILDATPDQLAELIEPDDVGATPRVGRKVGPYRIVREIGRGGMGTVYLAERADVDKQVALKLVRRSLTAPEAVEAFFGERRILARLEHPGVARLIDAGMDDGMPYLVMEYVPGEPLTDYCDQQDLGIDERLDLFAEVCAAVAYAHHNLVVHRDLKPSNIFVDGDGGGPPRVKLLDFGIAKLIEDDADDGGLTRTGWLAMTPAYAAPEQVRGEPVTTATDVYALGVILYELLAGRRPYEAVGPPSEIERLICDSQPARPSQALLRHAPQRRRQSQRLRGDLDSICLKAVAKEPGERYATAEALEADVRRHLAGLPVTARPQTAAYRIKKFVVRHRWGVAVALAATLLVACLIGFYTWRLAAERDRVVAALAESEAVTGFLVELFEANDPDKAQGTDPSARELLARGVARADALAGEPAIQARVLNAVGQVYSKLGRYDDAHTVLERALALRRTHLEPDDPAIAESAHNLGALETLMGRYTPAEGNLREALARYRALYGERHETVAGLANDLGSLAVRQGDFAAAEAAFRQALATNRARLGPGDPEVAINLSNLAYALYEQGRYEPAEALYLEALAIHRRYHGDVHTNVALVMNNLSTLYQDTGDHAAAEKLLREVLQIRRALQGEKHPSIATALNNLGTLLLAMERPGESAATHREALALRREVLGADHPLVAASQLNLGRTLTVLGEHEEAGSLLRAALAFRVERFGADHVYTANALTTLADLQVEIGAYGDAEAGYYAAFAIYDGHYDDPDHYRLRRVRDGLARLEAARAGRDPGT